MNISVTGQVVLGRMVRELMNCKYVYRTIVSGCYDACIDNYGLDEPEESKSVIVDKAIEILTLNKEVTK